MSWWLSSDSSFCLYIKNTTAQANKNTVKIKSMLRGNEPSLIEIFTVLWETHQNFCRCTCPACKKPSCLFRFPAPGKVFLTQGRYLQSHESMGTTKTEHTCYGKQTTDLVMALSGLSCILGRNLKIVWSECISWEKSLFSKSEKKQITSLIRKWVFIILVTEKYETCYMYINMSVCVHVIYGHLDSGILTSKPEATLHWQRYPRQGI